MTCFRAY